MEDLLDCNLNPDVFLHSSSSQMNKSKEMKFFVEDGMLDECTRIIKLRVKNCSLSPIRINSFLISDFNISNKGIVELLENGWGQSSFSGYRNFGRGTKQKSLFLKRDQNPFSFDPKFGYLENSSVNEWYTQIVKNNTAVVIGAITTKDQFAQVYLQNQKDKLTIRLTSQFDGLVLEPGKEVCSETFAIIVGNKEDSLKKFGLLLKRYGEIKNIVKPPIGLCCAYYHQGNSVNQRYILKQLDELDREFGKVDLDYIQIDAGYCVWGDWLETKNEFPLGMEYIVKEINKREMSAGIWIAPFVASPKSKLFKEHNNWFLKNDSGRDFEARFTSPFDILPGLQLRVLDVTLPEVQNYLTTVTKQFVKWGFELIKMDFIYPLGFNTSYHKQMTRAEALRTGVKVIRKAAGDKVHIMSGIAQLSPLVGLVDSARIGLDSVNPFLYGIPVIAKMINNWMLLENLRNAEARQFLNGNVWINDADCLVTNTKSGLTKKNIERHRTLLENYGGSYWVGDSL